jgi:hypothetical protein
MGSVPSGCRALGNPVLLTEGRVTTIDGLLAVAVLVGLVLNAIFGWWWADPLAALVLVHYALREAWHIFTETDWRQVPPHQQNHVWPNFRRSATARRTTRRTMGGTLRWVRARSSVRMGVPAGPGRTGRLVRSGHEGQRSDARAASGPASHQPRANPLSVGDLLVELHIGLATARNESIGDRSLRPSLRTRKEEHHA